MSPAVVLYGEWYNVVTAVSNGCVVMLEALSIAVSKALFTVSVRPLPCIAGSAGSVVMPLTVFQVLCDSSVV